MHGVPRSSADILASAPRLPPKKQYKTRTPNPFSSNENLARFLQEQPPQTTASTSIAENSQNRRPRTGFRKFMPPLGLTTEKQLEVEDGSGSRPQVGDAMEVEEHLEMEEQQEVGEIGRSDNEFEPTEENVRESPTSAPGETKKECFGEVLDILRSNSLSPFDLMLEMLDDSEPEHSCYRTDLYSTESRKLPQIIDHILSSPAGQRKLDEAILHHAVALVRRKVSMEMDIVANKLPGLGEIAPELIKSWNLSGHQETAPILSQILLTVADSASAREKNMKTPDSKVTKTLISERIKIHTEYKLKGARQFMSAEFVMDSNKLNTLQDDMQSFFWLFLYHTLRYMVHNEIKILEKKIKNSQERAPHVNLACCGTSILSDTTTK